MIQRGQKVEIISNISHRKLRPSNGDIGYLGNLFLFPREKFILTDVFIFSHKNKFIAVEKKKFVVDLGMENSCKHQISKIGVNKLFFVSKPNVCLNPTILIHNKNIKIGNNSAHKIIPLSEVSFPQLVGTYGIWQGRSNPKRKKTIADGLFRIPCGQLMPIGKPMDRVHMSEHDQSAWIYSMMPIYFSIVNAIPDFFLKQNDVSSLMSLAKPIHAEISNCFLCNNQSDGALLYKLKSPIKDVSKSQMAAVLSWFAALNINAIGRMNARAIDEISDNVGIKYKTIVTFANSLENGTLLNLIDFENIGNMDQVGSDARIVANFFFRTMFDMADIKSNLYMISDYLPKDINVENLSRKIEEAKSGIKSGTAALARILDIITKPLNKEVT